MEILGRIAAVRAPSRIEILHDQPWRGRLRLRFDADGPARGCGCSPTSTTTGSPGSSAGAATGPPDDPRRDDVGDVRPHGARAAARGVLLVHALMNEGGLGGDLRVQLGERPHGQLRAAVGPIMRSTGGRRPRRVRAPVPRDGDAQRCRSLALALDEPNAAFLRRYRARFGRFAPPLSSISEATYEAVHLYAAAARRAGEGEPRAVARALRRSRSSFPRGEVVVAGPETVRQRLFLAEARPGGFAVAAAT